MSSLPVFPVKGGCACGAVRYRLTAPPLAVVECYCGACQKITGSAFSLAMPALRDAFEITQGALATWVRTAESGNRIPQRFCAQCGTRIYTEPPGTGPAITLRAGTLDDASWVAPAAAIWTDSAQTTRRFDHVDLAFPRQPEDFRPVIGAWRAQMGL